MPNTPFWNSKFGRTVAILIITALISIIGSAVTAGIYVWKDQGVIQKDIKEINRRLGVIEPIVTEVSVAFSASNESTLRNTNDIKDNRKVIDEHKDKRGSDAH